jgi:hypothetical protein
MVTEATIIMKEYWQHPLIIKEMMEEDEAVLCLQLALEVGVAQIGTMLQNLLPTLSNK